MVVKDTLAAATRSLVVEFDQAGTPGAREDRVAVEEPLEIRLGFQRDGSRHRTTVSITMRTPGQDIALAAGFLFTEGIIRSAGDIDAIQGCGPEIGPEGTRNVVRVELRDGVPCDTQRLQRNFYTTSSCGVCGKTSLEALRVHGAQPVTGDGFRIDSAALRQLPGALRPRQAGFAVTGGIHAAACFDSEGRIVAVFEDVGRHNAFDKLIGDAFLGGRLPLAGHGLLASGRASFELLQKAMMAGSPLFAAVGAPSSLAVESAREFDITLVGFLKRSGFNIYNGAHRVLQDGGSNS